MSGASFIRDCASAHGLMRLTSGNPSVSPEISELESKLKALTLEELDSCKTVLEFSGLHEEGERAMRFFF